MTDKRRCSGLSKGWWWLLALLGLPFLYLLMLSAKWVPIEKDIQTRTTEQLISKGFDQVSVEIEKRGRDVLLTGSAVSEAARKQAVTIAKAVPGVRVVEDKINVVPLSAPAFALSTNTTNHKISLTGTMPSQEAVDSLLNATTEVFGKDRVENKLDVGEHIASPSWLPQLTPFLSDLKGVKNAALEISDDTQRLSGIVRTEDQKSNLWSKFTSIFGNKAIDQLTLEPLKQAVLQATYENENVVLEGVLGSREKINDLVENLQNKIGKDKLVNKLLVNDDYSDKDGIINLTGEATSKGAFNLISSSLKQLGETLGFKFNNKLTLNDLEAKAEAERIAREKAAAEKAEAERIAKEKAAAEKAEAERIAREKAAAEKAEAERIAKEKAAAEKAEAERIAREKAEAEIKAAEELFAKKLAEQKAREMKQIAACQDQLNKTMTGKTILFQTNKADIKSASYPLLDNIVAVIKSCRGKVEKTRIAVNGHTDSRGSDAYNLQLSQRRADAVRTYLINKGVDQSIITATGFGETQPVASNSTPEGRRQNRRINFSVSVRN